MMEVIYKVDNGIREKSVKVTCFCGNCSLITTKQLTYLRKKLKRKDFYTWPKEIKVIDN